MGRGGVHAGVGVSLPVPHRERVEWGCGNRKVSVGLSLVWNSWAVKRGLLLETETELSTNPPTQKTWWSQPDGAEGVEGGGEEEQRVDVSTPPPPQSLSVNCSISTILHATPHTS